ncbi:hypothetical protein NITHO_5780004 [Nitrolancea hollandica Lb]|uniref:Uncharacterized protein n=1 Tax=Nitrolancea hollandica Lb TaxID=1129897 RepID=I4EMA0_9BACT|nr:hypothetical protein NITHO_5780004 [Nitrolancea hollandica Lb]
MVQWYHSRMKWLSTYFFGLLPQSFTDHLTDSQEAILCTSFGRKKTKPLNYTSTLRSRTHFEGSRVL